VSAVTLPGTLPGLLRRGSPVVRSGGVNEGRAGLITLVEEAADGIRARVRWDNGGDCAFVGSACWLIALDLTDPTGMDTAARWLAEKVGLKVGATAPGWAKGGDGLGWGLRASGGDSRWFGSVPHEHCPDTHDRLVPGISALTDPAEALALACLAVSQ